MLTQEEQARIHIKQHKIQKRIWPTIKHLFPKRNIDGHPVARKVMRNMSSIFPIDKTLFTSFYQYMLNQKKDLSQSDINALYRACRIGKRLESRFPLKEGYSVEDLIENQKRSCTLVCCHSAEISAHYLTQSGYKPQTMNIQTFLPEYLQLATIHTICVFDTQKKLSGIDLMRNLDKENVQAVDYWAGQSGQALDVINHFIKFFSFQNNRLFLSYFPNERFSKEYNPNYFPEFLSIYNHKTKTQDEIYPVYTLTAAFKFMKSSITNEIAHKLFYKQSDR